MGQSRFRRAAAGQQYALIVGLIAIVAILAITQIGRSAGALMTNVANRMDAAGNSAGVGTGGGSAGQAEVNPGWSTTLASASLYSFSNANRTATANSAGTFFYVASATSRTGGKYYLEVLYANWTSDFNLRSSVFVSPSYDGGPNNATQIDSRGVLYCAAGASTYEGALGGAFSGSGWLGVAVDLDNGWVWFKTNGAWINGTPGLGAPTGGSPHCTLPLNRPMRAVVNTRVMNSPAQVQTLRVLASEFSGPVPAGFQPWGP